MKDAMKVIFGVVLVMSVTGLVVGMFNASMQIPDSNCNMAMSRIEYVIPTYRIGCWLGSPAGSE